MMNIGAMRNYGFYSAIAILCLVTGAVMINLWRGNINISCGCGGMQDQSQLNSMILWRNGILIGLTASGLAISNPSALSPVSVFMGAVLALSLLGFYIIVHQLMSTQSHIKYLRRAK
jgi:hypothetical protein